MATVNMTELLAKVRAANKKMKLEELAKGQIDPPREGYPTQIEDGEEPEPESTVTGMSGEKITYNQNQREAIKLAADGKPFVLIGAAGTGKTTASQGAVRAMIETGEIPILQSDGHKYLRQGAPGIVVISYTRRAVNNIRKVQSEDIQGNCITCHKLLEFAPEYFEYWDEEKGEYKNSMRFVPTRNAGRPLPSTIHTIIVEEASMLGTELWDLLMDAIQHKVQFIFIGDIQQLPPVFGPAILGYKLNELPVVELTEVYRQALESPIIRLAHRILSGKAIPVEEYPDWHEKDKLTIHPWKKKIKAEDAVMTLGAFFKQAMDAGVYDINEDMILLPFNKACGTIELNNIVANHIARTQGKETHEVIAGYVKHYYSIGDKVLYSKADAEVIGISRNAAYFGKQPQEASIHLDYWGTLQEGEEEGAPSKSAFDLDNFDEEALLAAAAIASDEDRVTQASHIIELRLLDTGDIISVDKAAEVNSMILSYALTTHKAQGSEWRKVFVCYHTSHATLLSREHLYTSITRAKEELYVICEPETFTKGIEKQRVKGDTLAEKAEFFKGKGDR